MKLKKIICYTVITVLFVIVTAVCSFADYTDVMNEYKNADGGTLIVSDMGDDFDYPDSVTDAVKADIDKGADIVKIYVSKTDNGVIAVKKDGDNENETVTLKEILSLFNDTVFMLDFDFGIKDDVYNEVKNCNALDRTIFYIGHQKGEDITLWLNSLENKPEIMTYFKGNVIFVATAYIGDCIDCGVDGIALATVNPYGVVFGTTVMNKCKSEIRAMALSSQPKICGKIRQDNAVWWDDLISRGFSMILTDNVEELREYLNETDKYTEKLKQAYVECVNNFDLPDFQSTTYIDYKKAYNDAKTESERLLGLKNVARSEVQEAKASLISAKRNIINDYDELANGTAGVTITFGRCVAAVLAVIGVSSLELFVYKHIKKKQGDK